MLGLIAAGVLSAPAASAKVWFEGGVFRSSALHGYNVVNHFTEGRSVEGQFKFAHSRMSTERLFTSTEHRACLLRVPKNMRRNAAAGGPGRVPHRPTHSLSASSTASFN